MTSTSMARKPSSSFAPIRWHATSFPWSAAASGPRPSPPVRVAAPAVRVRRLVARPPATRGSRPPPPASPAKWRGCSAPASARLRSHPSSRASSTHRHRPPHPDLSLSLHSPLSPSRPHSPLRFRLVIWLITSVSVLWINVDAVEA
jgi:hypothetical protein